MNYKPKCKIRYHVTLRGNIGRTQFCQKWQQYLFRSLSESNGNKNKNKQMRPI